MATTRLGYPYPLGTDRVMDGDNVVQALATAIDTNLGKACGGTALIPVTVADGTASVAVTFPAGLFTATPVVQTVSVTTSPQNGAAIVSNPTASGVTLYGVRASVGNVTAPWVAVQL